MNCSGVENLLDAHLDGQLSGSLRLEFEAHRLRCRHCQQTLAMMEAAAHVITHDRRGPALSDDFTDAVMGRLASTARPRWRLRPRTVALGLLAQAAAIALFVVILRAPGGSPLKSGSPTGDAAESLAGAAEHQDVTAAKMLGLLGSLGAQVLDRGAGLASDGALLNYFDLPAHVAEQSESLAEGDPVGLLLHALSPSAEGRPNAPVSQRHSL